MMINVTPSPGNKRLGKICERLGCVERKVLLENRGADILPSPGLSSARAFEPIFSASFPHRIQLAMEWSFRNNHQDKDAIWGVVALYNTHHAWNLFLLLYFWIKRGSVWLMEAGWVLGKWVQMRFLKVVIEKTERFTALTCKLWITARSEWAGRQRGTWLFFFPGFRRNTTETPFPFTPWSLTRLHVPSYSIPLLGLEEYGMLRQLPLIYIGVVIRNQPVQTYLIYTSALVKDHHNRIGQEFGPRATSVS